MSEAAASMVRLERNTFYLLILTAAHVGIGGLNVATGGAVGDAATDAIQRGGGVVEVGAALWAAVIRWAF